VGGGAFAIAASAPLGLHRAHGDGWSTSRATWGVRFSGEQVTGAGQSVLHLPERAAFELGAGRMTLIEVAPGVDLRRDVLAQVDSVPEIA
jgi:hypothetical protein